MVALGRRLALATTLVCIALQPSGADEDVQATSGRTDDAIHEAVFKSAIGRECKVIRCLLSVSGKGITDDLYRKLKDLGHVAPARPDDFAFEHGAYKGFSVRNCRILDVAATKRVSEHEAAVDVNVLTTAMNSRVCRFRALAQDDRWTVDDRATQCTIS